MIVRNAIELKVFRAAPTSPKPTTSVVKIPTSIALCPTNTTEQRSRNDSIVSCRPTASQLLTPPQQGEDGQVDGDTRRRRRDTPIPHPQVDRPRSDSIPLCTSARGSASVSVRLRRGETGRPTYKAEREGHGGHQDRNHVARVVVMHAVLLFSTFACATGSVVVEAVEEEGEGGCGAEGAEEAAGFTWAEGQQEARTRGRAAKTYVVMPMPKT